MFKYLAASALTLSVAVPASAATFVVDASLHSINSGAGSGLATGLVVGLGDIVTVSSSTDDLWSAGALPRWSDGGGLVGDRFATGSDDSGELAGTLIGSDFGLPDILGFSAPFGSLVGRYGDGSFQLFGANFGGAATGSGALTLFYWDTFTGDNFGDITFDVSAVTPTQTGAVPEPAAWALLLLGFGLAGAALRRRPNRTMRLRYS